MAHPKEDLLRCSSCVLPRNTTAIPFDESGTCSLCNAAKAHEPIPASSPRAEGDLEDLLEKIRARGRGRPYDCLVGLSGGRDSTYLLWLLVTKHKLRCLAAYYRTPFTPDAIDGNVRRLVSRLEVPLVEMDISREYHLRVARSLVRLWLRKPQPVLANLICAPCKLVNREAYRIARRNHIASIVYGGSRFEIFQLGAAQSTGAVAAHGQTGHHTLQWATTTMLRLAKRGVGALARSTDLWRYVPVGIQSSILYVNPHAPWLRLRYPTIRALDYFFHTDWNEDGAEAALREVGWELPPGANMTWRADCCLGELKNRMFGRMTGFTYVDAYFSNIVRAGLISREEGLQRLATEGRPSSERLREACRLLDIDPGLFP